MKNSRIGSLALAGILMGISLAGCAGTGDEPTIDKGRDAIHIVAVSAKALQEPIYGQEDSSVAAAAGANEFALALSAALARQGGDKNLVCSPYSVWLPLAALANATDARYRDALFTALGVSGIGEADINRAASRMLYDLTRQGDKKYAEEYHDPLKIANAIFVDHQMTLKRDFAQAFMDYYRGTAFNVDFRSADAVDAVNKWASDNTEALITNIVQEFNPATVAAIANAIYFSDRWQGEFSPEETREDVFHAPAGETKAFYMLREGDNQVYYEDDTVQAMPLRFRTGGGMYIMLPKDGDATGLLSSMTSGYFDAIKRGSIAATGKLLLPRFSIESEVMQLKDTLTALGIPLCDAEAEALTGLLEEMAVYVSSAVHKAVIKVDEKGTTAAAVTVLGMEATSAGPQPPTKPFEMNCNKPFVFVLYGDTYGGGSQILFTGIVNQP